MFPAKEHEENEDKLGKMPCTTEIQAAFILSSLVTFFGGLAVLLLFRLIWRSLKKWQDVKGAKIILELFSPSYNNPLRKFYLHGGFRKQIEILLSAQTVVGQVLVLLFFVLSIGSLIIYFLNSTDPVGSCASYKDKTIPIDLTFNVYFSFYFGLRFLAAADKVKFWLEMNSIVDIFTIPPTFISYYLQSNWLGLRFLRALRLLELPKMLQILQAIKSGNSVKFAKLFAIVFSTWFTAAGFIHLVENSGDPWVKGINSQNISYFESIYMAMATMSTVGFGDVVPKTSLGRIFIICFTLGSLVLFASYVPEMVEFFANKRKYTHSYKVIKGKKFIVVLGNITVDSVTAFLRNFLRHKAEEINTEIVFLGETPPSLELETIFKCNLAYTTFISGSALKWEDLKRAAVELAEACLILANPLHSDWHAEDTSNIMRVLSIKNYCPQARVIIQILQSHNKVFLPKIPSWNASTGDNIICFAELKLGFIAQGCLVPGLCTFLTSLFVEQNRKVSPKELWQKHFLDGLKNKILTQRLSDDFAGMSFPEVSRICFVKMNLMLIAIEHRFHPDGSSCCLILNPPPHLKLHKNTLGFFIAESSREVRRALFYCSSCHGDVHNPELIQKCGCPKKVRHHFSGTAVMAMKSHKRKSSVPGLKHPFRREGGSLTSHPSFAQSTLGEDVDALDSSGLFHWCTPTPLEKVILRRTDKEKPTFRNHIVACVFGDAHSALVGLRNFVMPLRTSNYTRQELKDIVFIGSLEYLQREWRFLWNFPKIHIMPGSALYFGDLHAINIEDCSMCAILAPPPKPSSSHTLVDTETIMATLNIGSLRFSRSSHSPSMPGILPDTYEYREASKYRRVPILTELKWHGKIQTVAHLQGTVLQNSSQRLGKQIFVVGSKLGNPSNIHFIEQLGELEGSLTGLNLHLSTSFSTGSVFSGNFLDSLLATAFYNYRVLELLQMLVTGGINSQLEQHLTRERHSKKNDSSATFSPGRMRCKLGLLPLNQTILSDIHPKTTFGQLFCGSLNTFGILCVGLYRVIGLQEYNPERKRFVITRPANEFKLMPSDLVFCAIPFHITCYKKCESSVSHFKYESICIEPLPAQTKSDMNLPTTGPVKDKTLSPKPSTFHLLKPNPSSVSRSSSQATELRKSSTLSVETSPNKKVGRNAEDNAKDSPEDDATYSLI